MSDDLAYRDYWRRKQLIAGPLPTFPVRYWWNDPGLSDIERAYFEAVAPASSLLDVGAGDLRIMRKLRGAGYGGEYHTQDIGGEFAYTYRDLAEVSRPYGAIICLDVIEHLPLGAGLAILDRLAGLLEPGGVLVLQTPNARYVQNPLGWDMTHVQCYNIADLWSFLTCLGLEVRAYRVCLRKPPAGPFDRLHWALSRFLVTRMIWCDYAQNIAIVARKPVATA